MIQPLTINRKTRYLPWLLLFSVLGVCAIFAGYVQVGELHRIHVREKERLESQVQIIDENLTRQLQGIKLALAGMRSEIPHWQSEGRIEPRLQNMRDAMPGIRTLLITDASGVVLATSRQELTGRNVSYREYFKIPAHSPSPDMLYISPPFTALSGVTVINVGNVLLTPDGRFNGVVSATLSPDYFTILLKSALYAPEMRISLGQGTTGAFLQLASSSRQPDYQGSSYVNVLLPYLPLQQVTASRVIQPAALVMNAPLVVSLARDMSIPHRNWLLETGRITALFGVFSLILAAGLYLYLRRTYTYLEQTSRYEAELRHTAERFTEISRQVPGAIFQFQLHTDGSSAIPYASDAISTLFRVNLDDVRQNASPLFSAILPEDLPVVMTSIQESARTMNRWDCQFRVCHDNEQIIWLHGTSTPRQETDGTISWYGYVSDITRRKHDEETLRDKEHFLSTLTDVIPGLLSYWNRELRCSFANSGYREWFGRERHEMAGIHIRDLLGEELFNRDLPYIEQVLAGERLHFERTLSVTGLTRNIWVNYIPDRSENQVHGFYVMVTDISELKQIQLKLAELNTQLERRIEETERASRSKSRFLATVAHEFRTPLSLLTSSSDILDRYSERLDRAELVRQHDHIRSAARQMSGLVDSVLIFNRLETSSSLNNPVALDIAGFCHTLSEEIRLAWCDGHQFNVSIADDCGMALLDEQLFRRVLENLLSNAFRYTPASGSVSLSVSRARGQVNVAVSDTGIGIPEECLSQVFDAFYRANNVEARRGLGLGLSIVHEALGHLNGTIAITSTVGSGTTMQVAIPCSTI